MTNWIPVFATVLTVLGSIAVGLFTRRGSKEQNEISREVRLDTANDKLIENLQEDNKGFREELRTLKENSKTMDQRLKSLERSRYAWKYWAQRVVPILEGVGVHFPPTPEKLEDTDPTIRTS